LTCNDCHSDDPFGDSLQTDCLGCHLEDDEHDGHNGPDCQGCHNNDSWAEIAFNHLSDTGFALNGSHQDVACNDCHAEPLFESSPGTECISCHVDDDVHEGSQGETCLDCHTESKWEEAPYFDHGLTRFPLLGDHANVECDGCHETQVFADTETACSSCHSDDDPHGDVFTGTCEGCHNPVAWDLWMFDHNTQTDYLLGGAHAEVECSDCHRSPQAAMQRVGGRCGNCHRADDKHDGEFGTDCDRCHSDSSFTEVRTLQ
jgi:hypothetical protein